MAFALFSLAIFLISWFAVALTTAAIFHATGDQIGQVCG